MKKAGDILRQYLKEKGWSSNDPGSIVFLEWKKLAGNPLGEHSEPVEWEDGVLLVEVDHPGWMQIMLMRKSALLDLVRKTAPGVKLKDIRVRLGAMGSTSDQTASPNDPNAARH